MADQPAYAWDDFALAAVPDPRTLATDRDPVTLHQDDREHQRVGDTGWHMTVCWYAGPDHAVRVRDEPGWHTVRTRVTRGGSVSSHSAPRTEADQDIIEADQEIGASSGLQAGVSRSGVVPVGDATKGVAGSPRTAG